MKVTAILLTALLIPLAGLSQQKISKLDKAKQLIRKEFKETMNDYASYSPVSYSKVDSLFTSASEDEFILKQYDRTIKAREEAGIREIPLDFDISPTIKKMEERPELYKDGAIENWKLYRINQQQLLSYIREFIPMFIGWKITHKFRAKNTYNATILKEQEFRFDKDMTMVTEIKDIDE